MKYRGNVGLNVGWEISIDLANDLQNIAYQLLQRRGYKDVDAKRALYQYYNLERRIVSNHKRVIHRFLEELALLMVILFLNRLPERWKVYDFAV